MGQHLGMNSHERHAFECELVRLRTLQEHHTDQRARLQSAIEVADDLTARLRRIYQPTAIPIAQAIAASAQLTVDLRHLEQLIEKNTARIKQIRETLDADDAA